jgi:mRNA-degrading endonuclease YafQ of YafQ-DinJ toxin-antitoxin module
MQELIARWRRRAPQEEEYFRLVADTLEECADELEQAWHDHAHDGEWRQDCRICKQEMELS